MNSITTLEAQHHVLASMMLRLVNLIQGFSGSDQAYAITLQLAKLAHLLRLHLAIEDEWFYPAMMDSHDPRATSLATTYRDEVGGIAEHVEAFIAQWNSSIVIELGIARFRAELQGLFHQIEVRISREQEELYPLARSLGIGDAAAAA